MKRYLVVSLMCFALSVDANQTTHFRPEPDRLVQKAGFVAVDRRSLPHQISLMRFNKVSAFKELPAKEQDWSQNLHGVVSEESLNTPGSKGTVSVENHYQCLNKQGDVGAVWLETSVIRHSSAVDSLGLASAVVENKGNGHAQVINDATSGDKINEPSNNLS